MRVRICSFVVIHKEHRYAPNAGKRDNNVDYSRKHRAGTARDPSNEVEGEKTYKTPVERAYYYEYERDFVNDRHNSVTVPFFDISEFTAWTVPKTARSKVILPHIRCIIRFLFFKIWNFCAERFFEQLERPFFDS